VLSWAGLSRDASSFWAPPIPTLGTKLAVGGADWRRLACHPSHGVFSPHSLTLSLPITPSTLLLTLLRLPVVNAKKGGNREKREKPSLRLLLPPCWRSLVLLFPLRSIAARLGEPVSSVYIRSPCPTLLLVRELRPCYVEAMSFLKSRSLSPLSPYHSTVYPFVQSIPNGSPL
jgi:hypothetical protein